MKLGVTKKTMVLAIAVCFTGCASAPGQPGGPAQVFNDTFNNADPCSNNARNIGIALGVGIGALLGAAASNKDKGAMAAGAAIGGLFGGLIGTDMDRKRCELSKIARQYQLDLAMATIARDGTVINDTQMKNVSNAAMVQKESIGSVVSLRDQTEQGGHFETNSDVLTLRARQYFAAIADAYNVNKAAAQIQNQKERQQYLQISLQHKFLLLGHTDDTGSSKFNADLSERRAKAVAQFMEQHGIPRDAIFYQGAGEVYPMADNNTEVGRAQNRRVEIIELADEANFQKFLAVRKPNYQFYRVETMVSASNPTISPKPKAPAKQASKSVQVAKEMPVLKGTGPVPRMGNESVASATPMNPAPKVAQVSKPQVALAAKASTSESQAKIARTELPSSTKPDFNELDFGGTPLTTNTGMIKVGKIEHKTAWFSLISNAYADEPAVLSDCSKDRPRLSGAVRALKNGAVYSTGEHVPSLYGKTWTDKVNGHQIVINKVAVLASEASLAQIPDLKVYANYNPTKNRNPKPDVAINPEVNTYLGESGILYRIFANGAGGMQCVDILYNKTGGSSAKAGKIVYAREQKLYVAEFKPTIVN
ncbi:MAG: hypothetical protein JWQ21_1221 [Herminiimonas sp.]|nr:hypothetical protein [Herminiimonas sp.]